MVEQVLNSKRLTLKELDLGDLNKIHELHSLPETENGADKETVEGIFDYLKEIIPLKKIGVPEDVAKLVVYLSDEASSYITGSDFVIDGGLVLN